MTTTDKTIASVMFLSILLILGVLGWRVNDIQDAVNELSDASSIQVIDYPSQSD